MNKKQVTNSLKSVPSFESQINNIRRDITKRNLNSKKLLIDEDVCPRCNTPLRIQLEAREGGYFETVGYCNGCGYTEIS